MDGLVKEIRENKAYILVVILGLAMAFYHLISTQVLLFGRNWKIGPTLTPIWTS